MQPTGLAPLEHGSGRTRSFRGSSKGSGNGGRGRTVRKTDKERGSSANSTEINTSGASEAPGAFRLRPCSAFNFIALPA